MKHFIKDITDQVVLDVKPYGRMMSFSQIAEVDAGNKFIKVFLDGVISVDTEEIELMVATYTDDMESDSGGYDWNDFDASEIRYMEKNLSY